MSVAEFLEDLFGLKGQVAVVIGGAGELGAALGMGLAKAGAHIVVADVTEEGCRKRVGEIEEAGGRATAATVDVTSGSLTLVPSEAGIALDKLLLTSDAGSFVTGQVLFADGGMVPR